MTDNALAIEGLARTIAAEVAAEHGPHVNAVTRAAGIADYLERAGIDLDDGDYEALADLVKDLTPTY